MNTYFYNLKNDRKIFLSTIFIIIFIGLATNVAGWMSKDGQKNFDWFSNDIMISDLMYNENYGRDSNFMKIITPDIISSDEHFKAEGVQPKMFNEYKTFDKSKFKDYTSNIVIQRFVYEFIREYIPVSHFMLIVILKGINVLLSAMVLTIIFVWVAYIVESRIIAVIIAIILSSICPYFTMYGQNLYWCMWSIFIPMASICLLCHSKDKINISICVIVGMISCFLKFLVYFEYTTTVLLSMCIPLLYEYIKKEDRNMLKNMVAVIIGGVLSFICVFGIKSCMLITQYGFTEAYNITVHNIAMRTLGTVPSPVTTNGPIITTLMMFTKTLCSVKGVFVLSMAGAFIILIILSYIFIKHYKMHKIKPLLYTTWGAIVPPVSWFIFAAPHTSIHNLMCSITWFCPFAILFLALFFKSVVVLRNFVLPMEEGTL